MRSGPVLLLGWVDRTFDAPGPINCHRADLAFSADAFLELESTRTENCSVLMVPGSFRSTEDDFDRWVMQMCLSTGEEPIAGFGYARNGSTR